MVYNRNTSLFVLRLNVALAALELTRETKLVLNLHWTLNPASWVEYWIIPADRSSFKGQSAGIHKELWEF